jgi:cyclopropane-fatty-acyl-phospholipid synthase
MTRTGGVAAHLLRALGVVLGAADVPLRLRAWDGSEAGPEGAPAITVHSRRALRRLVWAPGQLGLGRAYVAGDIDIEDDVFATFAALSSVGRLAVPGHSPGASARERLELLGTAVRLGALGSPPAAPPEEIDPGRHGRRHTRGRDAVTVSHHYDVGNDFYALVLGPSMVYSCAVWEDAETGLDAAQEAKLDLVCPACGCWTWAAAGAAWPCTLRSGTGWTSSASPSPPSRQHWRASGPPRPG